MKIRAEQTYKEKWRGKEEETLLFSLLTIIFYEHFPVLSINYDVLHFLSWLKDSSFSISSGS